MIHLILLSKDPLGFNVASEEITRVEITGPNAQEFQKFLMSKVAESGLHPVGLLNPLAELELLSKLENLYSKERQFWVDKGWSLKTLEKAEALYETYPDKSFYEDLSREDQLRYIRKI